MLRALRDLGMSMDDIQTAAQVVREEFDDPYALARKRIATDGVTTFVRLADESVVPARSRQQAFREIPDGYLRYIDWGPDGTANRLHLKHFSTTADVIIDPRFSLGAPVLADRKLRVSDLVNLRRTGERSTTVAEEYSLSVEDVLRQAA